MLSNCTLLKLYLCKNVSKHIKKTNFVTNSTFNKFFKHKYKQLYIYVNRLLWQFLGRFNYFDDFWLLWRLSSNYSATKNRLIWRHLPLRIVVKNIFRYTWTLTTVAEKFFIIWWYWRHSKKTFKKKRKWR